MFFLSKGMINIKQNSDYQGQGSEEKGIGNDYPKLCHKIGNVLCFKLDARSILSFTSKFI